MALMVSVSGIRGIVGEDLTPGTVVNYVSSFIETLGKKSGTILLGRDTRRTSPMIQKIVEATANALGFNTLDVGVAPTPMVLFLTKKKKCAGGIAITASHNPAEWNALKLCTDKGFFLSGMQVEELKENAEGPLEGRAWTDFKGIGTVKYDPAAKGEYLESVLRMIDTEAIRKKKLVVAFDPVGGAGCSVDRDFLEALGCTVHGVHDKPRDVFPRSPEPVPENLSDLSALVKKCGACIGFAQDPDADRLSVVSERGVPAGEEYTLVLSGEAWLRRKKTDIACNLSTSMMVDDLASRYGVGVKRTKIGEINVTETLISHNLVFGGEGNGGVIVPEINPCRDSLVGMGLILELLALSGKTVSELIGSWPRYNMLKDRVRIPEISKSELFDRILIKGKKLFPNFSSDLLDGIKYYNKSEWVHIRFSNTEPIIRIMAESPSPSRTEDLLSTARLLVGQESGDG